MRIMCVHPGADFSVSDVYDGLARALVRAGHEVISYALNGRLGFAQEWLTLLYERRKVSDPGAPEPTVDEIVHHACSSVLERVAWYQPEVVLIISSIWFSPPALIELRRLGCFVGIVLTESPYNDDEQAKRAALVNVVWTNDRVSVAPLRQANPNAFYLAAAYDEERHRVRWDESDPIPSYTSSHDVIFVGTGFPERIALLEQIDWSGIDLGLYGTWDNVEPDSPIGPFIQGGAIPNAHAVALYRRAKIALNLHRSAVDYWGEQTPVTHAESLNPRAYELAASGVFTISDPRPEVAEVFGDLVPTFNTPAELEQLIRQYLVDDEGRARIAARLPAAVAGETFDTRAAQLVADIERVRERGSNWQLATTDVFPEFTYPQALGQRSR